MSNAPDDIKSDFMKAILPHVAFDGWSEKAIVAAANDIGQTRGMVSLAFPDDCADMVKEYLADIDRQMVDELSKIEKDALKIRERIATSIKVRLSINAQHKEVVRRTVSFLALPHNVPLSMKTLWKTADAMWFWAGDTATDYNHYTKRLILSGVYSSTLLYWLNDDSDAYEDTLGFLDRRIDNVMQFEKAKAKAIKAFGDLPNIFKKPTDPSSSESRKQN